MTPQRKDLHEELEAGMDLRGCEDDAAARRADPKLYEYPVSFLLKVSSPSAQEVFQAVADGLTKDEASHVAYLEAIHGHVDSIHDNIEQAMLAARSGPAPAESKAESK